jgi:capsular polysaccharide biosynthesis protein
VQTNLESQVTQTNISILTPATPPLNHSSPKVVLNTIIAVFLGILLGIGVALLLELSDQRVRGSEDLMQNMDIPLLGVIPGWDKPRSSFRAARRQAAA